MRFTQTFSSLLDRRLGETSTSVSCSCSPFTSIIDSIIHSSTHTWNLILYYYSRSEDAEHWELFSHAITGSFCWTPNCCRYCLIWSRLCFSGLPGLLLSDSFDLFINFPNEKYSSFLWALFFFEPELFLAPTSLNWYYSCANQFQTLQILGAVLLQY